MFIPFINIFIIGFMMQYNLKGVSVGFSLVKYGFLCFIILIPGWALFEYVIIDIEVLNTIYFALYSYFNTIAFSYYMIVVQAKNGVK